MSLTLDEVRQIRFRMSRRNETGYQVGDVDNFIDKVELTFDEHEKERERLRRELESAQASATGEGFTGGRDTDGDDSELRSQLEAQAAELRAKDDELARLQSDVERLNQAINQGGDVAAVQSAADERINDLVAQNEQLRSQLEQVRSDFDRVRAEQVTAIGGVEHLTVSASHDAAPAVTRLLQMATDQATTLVNEAQTEAQRKIAEAEQRAAEIKTDARTKAERVESEARVNAEQMTNEARAAAEKMTSEAEARAAAVDTEVSERRRELFTDLEREQGELTGKVTQLRTFENDYRDNLTGTLERFLNTLRGEHPEPADVPELAQGSETPRLDALANGDDD